MRKLEAGSRADCSKASPCENPPVCYHGRLLRREGGAWAMAIPVSTTVLRTVPLFAGFPDEQLRLLVSAVNRRNVPRGTIVIVEGDPTDSLYIIISGRLKVMMSDAEGKEVILAMLGPGGFFGELGLIDDSPRSATAMAVEPCELITLAKKDFKK